MPSTELTLEQYVDVIRRSKLLTAEELHRELEDYRSSSHTDEEDPMPFSRRLQEHELLTPWQNDHLLGGRCRGFYLGKYKLLQMLGAGGMGAVYLAEHVMMHRRVAVKVLYIGQVDKTTLERFYQEARAVSALDHLNIVRAHHFDSSEDFLYLVMEFVDGPDLSALVKRYGRLPYWEAADYTRQAAAGLAHAHEAGLVHRDVKPANLLRDPRGIVKLLDLGVARMAKHRDQGATLTVAGAQHMLGTVDYQAPEQALDAHKVDHRADIYSLGCTLYYMLTGHQPFPEGTPAHKLMAHQMQKPTPISKERPDVPPKLAEFCDRMMAKDPADRFQSATEVAQTLQDWSRSYRESIGMIGPVRPDQLTGLKPPSNGPPARRPLSARRQAVENGQAGSPEGTALENPAPQQRSPQSGNPTNIPPKSLSEGSLSEDGVAEGRAAEDAPSRDHAQGLSDPTDVFGAGLEDQIPESEVTALSMHSLLADNPATQPTSSDPSVKNTVPQEVTPTENPPEHHLLEVTPQDNSPQEAIPLEDSSSEDSSSEEASPQQRSPQDSFPEEDVVEETAPERAAPEKKPVGDASQPATAEEKPSAGLPLAEDGEPQPDPEADSGDQGAQDQRPAEDNVIDIPTSDTTLP